MKQNFNQQSNRDEIPAEANLEGWLRAAMYRQNCPEPMILGEYQLGLLGETEQARIQAHLDICPHCQAELVELVDFLAEGVYPPVVATEDQSPNWVQELGFEWQRIRESGRIMIRLLSEALSGVVQPAPIALRGHQAEQENILRRFTLTPDQIEDVDLEVTITRQTDNPQQCIVTVLAQVPSRWPDLSGVQVQATAGGWHAIGVTDETGETILADLPVELLELLLIEVSP